MGALFGSLFGFLKCLLQWVVAAALAGLVTLGNLLVAALAALATLVLTLLPDVDLPTISLPPSLAWANWLFPLDQAVIAGGVVVTVLLAWIVVGVGLRWAKVIA
jgi:hypothetical protein